MVQGNYEKKEEIKKKKKVKRKFFYFSAFLRIIKKLFRSKVKSITPKIFRVHFASEIIKHLFWAVDEQGGGRGHSPWGVVLNDFCDLLRNISHQLIPSKCALTQHKNCTWGGWFTAGVEAMQVGGAGRSRERGGAESGGGAAVTIQVTTVNANEFYT